MLGAFSSLLLEMISLTAVTQAIGSPRLPENTLPGHLTVALPSNVPSNKDQRKRHEESIMENEVIPKQNVCHSFLEGINGSLIRSSVNALVHQLP